MAWGSGGGGGAPQRCRLQSPRKVADNSEKWRASWRCKCRGRHRRNCNSCGCIQAGLNVAFDCEWPPQPLALVTCSGTSVIDTSCRGCFLTLPANFYFAERFKLTLSALTWSILIFTKPSQQAGRKKNMFVTHKGCDRSASAIS